MAEKKSSQLWDRVKATSCLLLVFVLSYKIYITPFNIVVDFPTLLSLLLALFSVGLSALFYFKATETSNAFYDNSYAFTQDIAQLLIKIESGFGEKLKHLDEGYSSMRDYLQNSHDKKPNEVVEETKQKIKDEKHEIEKVASERNEIIQQLVERAQLQEAEKAEIFRRLKEKEDEVSTAQNELSKMNKRLIVEKMKRNRSNSPNNHGFNEFTLEMVIHKMGVEKLLNSRSVVIQRNFERLARNLPQKYLGDMESEGYFLEGGLTKDGVNFLRSLAENYV